VTAAFSQHTKSVGSTVQAVDSFTTSDGVRIVYRDWRGEVIAGPPVILHHGFATDARFNWERTGVVSAFTDTGRRVVAPDARGHGRSDKPHDPARYGEERMAQDLSELLDHLAFERVDLVGYSMGAVVALIAATRDTRIRRLAVGGVGAAVVELGGVDRRQMDRHLLADALRLDDPEEITVPMARAFRDFADATPLNDRFALAAHSDAVHHERIPLERITAPTLVIVGRVDPLARRPEVLADAIAGARLQIVDGDHLGAVVAPDFADSLVRHLAID
jgi:pimeloyl-ACP methyl ester carboxylesterase